MDILRIITRLQTCSSIYNTWKAGAEWRGWIKSRPFTDIVRSMMSTCHSWESLYGEALKIVADNMNSVLNISVPNTPFELWIDRKPSLNHLRVKESPSEVKIYNPQIKINQIKSMIFIFVSYLNRCKGYWFYCPSRGTKLIESINAKWRF